MAIFDQNEEELSLDTVEPYVPGQTQISPEYTEPEVYEPGEEGTVAGQMTGILSSGSPYMEAARKSGERTAHKRGLLNTSLAGEASQKAAIESALPIAQQDAATVSKAGLQKQAFGEQAALTDIQAGASYQLSAQEQRGANYRQQQEIALSERLSLADVGLSERNAIASHMTTLGDNFQAKVAGIQVDPGLSDKAKASAIESVQNVYEANIESIGAIYGVEIDWGVAASPATQTTAQTTTTPATSSPVAPVRTPTPPMNVEDITWTP